MVRGRAFRGIRAAPGAGGYPDFRNNRGYCHCRKLSPAQTMAYRDVGPASLRTRVQSSSRCRARTLQTVVGIQWPVYSLEFRFGRVRWILSSRSCLCKGKSRAQVDMRLQTQLHGTGCFRPSRFTRMPRGTSVCNDCSTWMSEMRRLHMHRTRTVVQVDSGRLTVVCGGLVVGMSLNGRTWC